MLVLVGIAGLILPGPGWKPVPDRRGSGVVGLGRLRPGRGLVSNTIPKPHAKGMQVIGRFIADLEAHYPSLRSTGPALTSQNPADALVHRHS